MPRLDQKHLEAFLAESHASGERVFAVLDPTPWPDLDTHLIPLDLEWMALAKGQLTPEHYQIVPRVVSLAPWHPFIPVVAERLGDAGILVNTLKQADFCDLIVHLWDLAHIYLPTGKKGWFRYYEPYVLHAWASAAYTMDLAAAHADIIESFTAAHHRKPGLVTYPRPQDAPAGKLPLRLSYEQLEAFDTALNDLFLCELSSHLAAGVYQKIPPDFEKNVTAVMETAQQHGLQANSQIRRFAELAVAHGWSFYAKEPASDILADTHLAPEARLSALEDALGKGA